MVLRTSRISSAVKIWFRQFDQIAMQAQHRRKAGDEVQIGCAIFESTA